MALTQASLATKIQTEMIAQFGAPADSSVLQKFANAIAKAIVDEIQDNAAVSGTVTSGVGSGGSISGVVD